MDEFIGYSTSVFVKYAQPEGLFVIVFEYQYPRHSDRTWEVAYVLQFDKFDISESIKSFKKGFINMKNKYFKEPLAMGGKNNG